VAESRTAHSAHLNPRDNVVGNDCMVTMSSDKTVTATFDDPVILAPSNGM
jgi:hypothetical protein